jgi:hypothetical protein
MRKNAFRLIWESELSAFEKQKARDQGYYWPGNKISLSVILACRGSFFVFGWIPDLPAGRQASRNDKVKPFDCRAII